MWLQQRVASGGLSVQKVDGVSNVADALTKHLGKSSLSSHTQSVRLEIRDGRYPLMPICDSADKAEISAAVSFESEERLCQVALANCFVRVNELGPEHGSTSKATRLFDMCCIDRACVHYSCCMFVRIQTACVELLTTLY